MLIFHSYPKKKHRAAQLKMHGRGIVAGGHRKEHCRRLVHGATWEVRRVGRARWLKTWGSKWSKGGWTIGKTKPWKTMKNRKRSWWNVECFSPKLVKCREKPWTKPNPYELGYFLFQGPAKQKLGLLRVTLPNSSNQNNVLIFQVLSSDLCLLVQKGPCLHRLDLLKLPSQKLFQIPWPLYHEPSANLRHGV